MCSCEKEVITNSISWADFFIPFFASASGAYIAFYLEDKKEKRKQRKKDIVSANKSIVCMIQQINCLASYYQEYLFGKEFDSPPCLTLKPLVSPKPLSTTINFEEISFLVEKGKSELFQDLLMIQEKFDVWVHSMELYCDYRGRFEDYAVKNGVVPKTVSNDPLFIRTNQLAEYIVNNTSPLLKDIISKITFARSEYIKLYEGKSIITINGEDLEKLKETLGA